MCLNCARSPALSRRQLLAHAAAGFAATALPAGAVAASRLPGVSPEAALERLKQGNARFVNDSEACLFGLAERRRAVAGSQAPWATIVSCADSRVPPELVFGGVGPGELFVVRNAGNMVDQADLGTIEYGTAVLGSSLIVVMGHERCGAVAAACDMVLRQASFPGAIHPMVEEIAHAVRNVAGRSGEILLNATQESARMTVRKLPQRSEILQARLAQGLLWIVPAYYDLDSGVVSYL